TGLTGDDIKNMLFNPANYAITDTLSNAVMLSDGPGGKIVFYGELATHFPYSPLGGTYGHDIFHTHEAMLFCNNAHYGVTNYTTATFTEGVTTGRHVGGAVSGLTGMKSLFIGNIAGAIKTGGNGNPELFVSGGDHATTPYIVNNVHSGTEMDINGTVGAALPRMLVMVKGQFGVATSWSFASDGAERGGWTGAYYDSVAIGHSITAKTGWNLADMYYVNDSPGTPLTQHKPDRNDTTNKFVTQVNYVTGYVCEASFQ
ncbi:hypothetical protein WAF85_004969, partial [Salmonella enterica]